MTWKSRVASLSLLATSLLACRSTNNSSTRSEVTEPQPNPAPIVISTEESPIVVLVTASIRSGTIDSFLAAIPDVTAGTRNESGNLGYYPHRSIVDTNSFTFLEKWDNSGALIAHRTQPHTTVFFGKIGTLLTGPPVGEKFRSVAGTDARVKPTSPTKPFYYVFSTVRINESHPMDASLKALINYARASRQEDGNVGFEIYQSVAAPNKFVSYEIWTTALAKKMHDIGKFSQEFSRNLGGSFTAPVETNGFKSI